MGELEVAYVSGDEMLWRTRMCVFVRMIPKCVDGLFALLKSEEK